MYVDGINKHHQLEYINTNYVTNITISCMNADTENECFYVNVVTTGCLHSIFPYKSMADAKAFVDRLQECKKVVT